MNPPWCSRVLILNPLPPPSPYHLSGSSQCTSPKHPVSCIEPRLAIHFTYDIIHVLLPFSPIIPPSPSPTESKRLFYTSVSLLLSHIQGYHYHLSKFHIYVLNMSRHSVWGCKVSAENLLIVMRVPSYITSSFSFVDFNIFSSLTF